MNLLGQTIGRYQIEAQLGEGGMATVYRALDTRLDRMVAIKFIRKDAFTTELLVQVLARFEREAKALARLSHPNIVKVHDYGEFEGSPYLVMEYVRGGTLKERKSGIPIPWEEASRLLTPVARALNYAHLNQIVHRDIKPSNILITDSGDPMLSDFGIAKILDVQEHTQLTSTGTGVGTPDYMAPEQWMGKVVPQTDIYALGIVFYELVTGKLPFRADTPAAVLIKHMSDPLPRPRSFNPDLPEAVEWVLYKALAKKPEDRYADMGAFASALEKRSQGKLELPETERPAGVVEMESESAGQTSTQTASQVSLQPTPSVAPAILSTYSQPATETAPHAGQTATISAAAPSVERLPAAPKKKRTWIPRVVFGGLGGAGGAAVVVALLVFKPFSSLQPLQTQEQEEAQVAETPAQQEEIHPVMTQEEPAQVEETEAVNAFEACMIFSGTRDDNGWNASTWEGMQQAQDDYGISIDYVEVFSEDEYMPEIAALVDSG